MKISNAFLCLGMGLLFGFSALPANAAHPIRLPDCQVAFQPVTLDLSTTTPTNWSVTGPAPAAGPTLLTQPFWNGGLQAYWVQPSATSTTAQSFPAGDYTYRIQFVVPCEPANYSSLSLTGAIGADNSFKAFLNGSATPFANCPGPTCFAGPTNFASIAGSLVQGVNTITVVVHNDETYTGLAFKATLVARCGWRCCVTLPVAVRQGTQTE